MKFQVTIITIIMAYCLSCLSINAQQISRTQFKGALDEDSPIFQIRNASDNNMFTGNVGEVIFNQTANFENLKPDSNLVNYTPLTYEITVASISTDELVLETKTYNANFPDTVLPWRHKIPLPLTEETIIELELLPTLKNMWRKVKFIVQNLPLAQLKINSVENDTVELELVQQFETWAFSPDLTQRLIILENKKHTVFNLPVYTVELVD